MTIELHRLEYAVRQYVKTERQQRACDRANDTLFKEDIAAYVQTMVNIAIYAPKKTEYDKPEWWNHYLELYAKVTGNERGEFAAQQVAEQKILEARDYATGYVSQHAPWLNDVDEVDDS